MRQLRAAMEGERTRERRLMAAIWRAHDEGLLTAELDSLLLAEWSRPVDGGAR